ncbi:Ribbon-helix-helix protein, copG family [Halovenus aranensis]|uniref:Ribbon-helix-helix protein, copG family n=1 Tax=Halovenus aranensis TaxID=890420 RepID=A0A1G8UF37_9EURY|nr:ribbon-helix-helix domain-containing protein [Halovenus aranensis]SDJ52339.1 Ribbon-helix-helix protein, copG family [Halovenus aranensis]
MTMDWNPDKRYSFGCSSDAMEKFDEIADREGKSRSEKLRELVEEEVRQKTNLSGRAVDLPDNDELAAAYQTLHEEVYADHRSRPKMRMEDAKNLLYSTELPKDNVVDKLIKPLEKRGYVTVGWGLSTVWVGVRPMTDSEDYAEPPQEATA